ncbi:MAG: TonB-dependent receptor domain-containing protein, partial [Flavobacteriales bacterium]
MKSLLFAFLFFLGCTAMGQQLNQTIRGTVIDKQTRTPLPGANVVLADTSRLLGVSTDAEGRFRLEDIPVGRRGIRVTYMGYSPVVVSNINLTSGREMVLNIEMDEMVLTGKVVEIVGKRNKGETVNKMATTSARTFSVEETGRYAGSMNDVARMAANYAGVQSFDDWRNDVIIRGNSPTGVLYRLEGVDIPSPNHFTTFGTTGGPVSILNNNTLANSDFLTGAFPAEYGNALSGVFDLKMRNGNNEKREFVGQIGFNGAELLAEGPFSKKHSSSYLLSYRYSTMDLFKMIGIHFGTLSVPEYQDITFKMNFPHRHGKTSVFGIGGLSHIDLLDSEIDTTNNAYGISGWDVRFKSSIGAAGISHTRLLGKTAYIKAVISANIFVNNIDEDSLSVTDRSPVHYFNRNSYLGKYSCNAFINKKFSSHHLLKAGLLADWMFFNLSDSTYIASSGHFITIYDFDGNSRFFQPYAQWQYRITGELTLNTGLHFQYFLLNGDYSLEPRAGIKWKFSDLNTIAFGYGLHSQLQPVQVYFERQYRQDGSFVIPNEDIQMTKSHHFVLSYDWLISESTRFKTEAYYQQLFHVPVNIHTDAYSMLNQGADFDIGFPDTLQNTGKGKNYGVELTFERFLSKGLYYLLTVSLFESLYEGSDGMERSTAFNGNYTCNALAGKEFSIPQKEGRKTQKAIFIDIKGTWNGGQRYTPIDLSSSQLAGHAVYDLSQ